jgi:outer membrane protein OmpA-like peptidoglycan-associated protein
MKALARAASLAILFACSSFAHAAAPADQDLAAFANGGLVEHVSSNYGGGWDGMWLIDESPTTGWAPEKDAKGPFEIVISLPEKSEIHAVGFDTAHVDGDNRAAKNVDVLISDESATSGFRPLANVTLANAKDGQRFAVTTPGAGRWLKLVVKSNFGDADYSEIMNFRAFGKAVSITPVPNATGTYSTTSNLGKFHLLKNGAKLTGCYEYKGGLVQGGLDGHVMHLTWSEKDTDGTKSGPAVMVQTRDGKAFKGFWRFDNETEWHSDWDLKKIGDKVGSCPNWNPTGKTGNLVSEGLADTGRVRLYGINFDSDSDKLRSDAKPALQQLDDALKTNPAWNVTIEGHTDSTSTPAHNLDLSKRRADAVKAWLAANGIDARRLSTQGFGQGKPIADNATEIGRAQNRRVEIARP